MPVSSLSSLSVTVAPHPLLDAVVFACVLPAPLEQLPVPAELLAWIRPEAQPGAGAPFDPPQDATREAVRALLRAGGFKPSGRSKPAAEYLLAAVPEGRLGSINLAVDACNVASFHSGLPISVVDLDRLAGQEQIGSGAGGLRIALQISVAPEGSRYVFNASGQELDAGRLLCLHDPEGPCANAVKDAQRTKTGPATTRTLSVIWGSRSLPGRAEAVARWYRSLLEQAGAVTAPVAVSPDALTPA